MRYLSFQILLKPSHDKKQKLTVYSKEVASLCWLLLLNGILLRLGRGGVGGGVMTLSFFSYSSCLFVCCSKLDGMNAIVLSFLTSFQNFSKNPGTVEGK